MFSLRTQLLSLLLQTTTLNLFTLKHRLAPAPQHDFSSPRANRANCRTSAPNHLRVGRGRASCAVKLAKCCIGRNHVVVALVDLRCFGMFVQ